MIRSSSCPPWRQLDRPGTAGDHGDRAAPTPRHGTRSWKVMSLRLFGSVNDIAAQSRLPPANLAVAFTRNGFKPLPISDHDISASISHETHFLQFKSRDRHRSPADAEHLGKTLLC